MSKSESSGIAISAVTAALVSMGVFIVGFLLLGVLPTRVSLAGGLRTDCIEVGDGSGGRLMLTTKPEGAPTITLDDASGNTLLSLHTAPRGGAGLDISAPDGTPLVRIITSTAKPVIRVYDPATGEVAWEAPGE